ncbi:hypothetical protein ACK3TF_002420 [Chlorella vulgaris]
MEGMVSAAGACVASIVHSCLNQAPRGETLRLSRFASKLGLLITETSLCLRSNEALRGSKALFMAVDATVSALRQAEQLMLQCAATDPSSIWPLEDAVDFQSVAAEMRSAAGSLAALGERLPRDVRQDAAHFYRQLLNLNFTEEDLEDTEELALEAVPQPAPQQEQQQVPQYAATASPSPPPAAEPAVVAGAAPPAAPAGQFTSPQAALASGAVAVSQLAAAQASSPASLTATAEAQQRHDLASAAAVAVESAAEVLSDGNGGEEAAGQSMLEEQEAEMAGEEREAMQQELRAEAASTAEDEPAVVVEQDGTTALPALAVVKGAVPASGSAPLPRDPFEMSEVAGVTGGVTGGPTGATSALPSLEPSRHPPADLLAPADDVLRQLEAGPDFQTLQEQQQQQLQQLGGAGGGSPQKVLAALQQLQESAAVSGQESG